MIDYENIAMLQGRKTETYNIIVYKNCPKFHKEDQKTVISYKSQMK
jgi:hypothetical protein